MRQKSNPVERGLEEWKDERGSHRRDSCLRRKPLLVGWPLKENKERETAPWPERVHHPAD